MNQIFEFLLLQHFVTFKHLMKLSSSLLFVKINYPTAQDQSVHRFVKIYYPVDQDQSVRKLKGLDETFSIVIGGISTSQINSSFSSDSSS